MSAAALVVVFATISVAQNQSKPSIPVKVQVVISRYEGDKKVSSLPYTLAVTASDYASSQKAMIRMGSSIPVPQPAGGGTTAYVMQSVGTNIDCRVSTMEDSRYAVYVSINDSSIMERRSPDAVPTLRNFISDNTVVLRDGQTSQFTAVADKNTGEIVKVDVTLTVEKEK
jgi:hypothetical protein